MSGAIALMAAGALLSVPAASAAPVRGVRAAVQRPIAPRGGALMLPLAADRPGDGWPQALRVALADGRTIDGRVAWIEPGPHAVERNWTDEARGLEIRAIRPEDDTSVYGPGRPILLVPLPSDGDGPIHLGSQRLDVSWRDVPRQPPPAAATGESASSRLERSQAPDLPDPESPFAYWRWILLAETLGLQPPSADAYGPVGRLLAEYEAALWHIGLHRLAAADPEAAEACHRSLTRTCLDEGISFAAWETDPEQIALLLSILLSDRPDDALITTALAWVDARDAVLAWPEATWGDQVRLAMVNATDAPLVARMGWLHVPDDIPIAVELPPGLLTRAVIERPPAPRRGPLELPSGVSGQQILLLQVAGGSRQITVGEGVAVARPPAAFAQMLRPALRLAALRVGAAGAAVPDRATFVQLRRRGGRWEVFVDCRRPKEARPDAATRRLEDLAGYRQTAGLEAVTLLLGPESPEGGPRVALTVPETGWHRVFNGRNDGTLQIHRRSYPDRWLCRIVLPDSWLPDPREGMAPLLIGVRRTHAGSAAVDTAPLPTVPWEVRTPRSAIDLTRWEAPLREP